jgi:hypothetical protein
MPLLISALFIALGFLVYPISARLSVIGLGIGSVIMGVVVITDLPQGFEIQTLTLFGITVVVGAWMVSVGLKEQKRDKKREG